MENPLLNSSISFKIPENWSFIQTLDLFIKIHHLFNFEYGKAFSKAMQFFDYVLYGISENYKYIRSSTKLAEVIMVIKKKDPNNNG